MLKSQNNLLICTPIKEAFAKSKKLGNLEILSAPTGLAALTVLMDGYIHSMNYDEFIEAGSTVYVRAEQYTTDWAKKVKECEAVVGKDGKPVRFIIVPGSEVVFVNKGKDNLDPVQVGVTGPVGPLDNI